MAKNKSSTQKSGGVKPGPGGGAAFRVTGFPREFERNIWDDLDKRFYLILFGSWLLMILVTGYLGSRDYASEELADKIRARYLQQLGVSVQIDVGQEEDIGEGPGIGEEPEEEVDDRAERDAGKREEVRGQSASERAAARRAAASARGRERQQMEQAVAGTGILGVLSAGGSGGTGDAVADVLGGAAGGTGDLDAVLSGVGGLATASSAGQRTRLGSRGGGRASGSADISDLVGGIGAVGSKSIGRSGSIKMALESARVSGKGTKSANRSSNEISRVINSHNDAVEFCYKRESRINPNLKGDLIIEFVIGWNGRIISSKIVSSSINNKNIENCVKGRIRSWRFKPIDKSEGDVTVRQKYIFG
jgi:TonB family protein